MRLTYDAGRKSREEQGRATGSYTLDAALLELDAAFEPGAEGLQSFATRRTPGAMDAERMLAEEKEVGMMNPDIVMI